MVEEQRFRERHLDSFLGRMPIADGANQNGQRDWLERVVVAFEVIHTLLGLAKVSTGILLQAQHAYPAGPGATLAGLVGHLRNNCMSAREGERLVQEVDTYRQGSYQPMVEYVATFRERVNRAYTPEDMANAKIARYLIKTFVNGIYSERVRFDAAGANPVTLVVAFEAAIAADNRSAWIRRDGRVEEPMEVGAFLPPPPPELLAFPPTHPPAQTTPTRSSPDKEDLGQLVTMAVSKQLAGFQKQLAEIRRAVSACSAAPPAQHPPTQVRAQIQAGRQLSTGSTDGCFYCGRPGHIRRDCRKMGADRRGRMSAKN